MTFDDARAAIYTRLDNAIAANSPSTKVEYENRHAVDMATQAEAWVAAEIHFNDGEQISLGSGSPVRYRGAVYLAVYSKPGEGTKATLTLLNMLAGAFKISSFSGVVCQAPRPLPGRDDRGWYVHTLRVPFYFYDS